MGTTPEPPPSPRKANISSHTFARSWFSSNSSSSNENSYGAGSDAGSTLGSCKLARYGCSSACSTVIRFFGLN